MARSDDQTRTSGSKTTRAVNAAGHGSSGGHAPKGNTSALAKNNQRQWDHHDMRHTHTPYVFHEYPKHVIVDGVTHLCNSADEEEQAKSSGKVFREVEERRRLLALAEVNGVTVDGRWRIDKIAQTISDAGFDPDANPFA